MKLSIIMPVFNEAETIHAIIEKVRELPMPFELVLVNDASSDGSAAILDEYGKDDGVVVLHHPVNRGKGAALATALKAANGDVAVIQDADLEYDPQDFVKMLELMKVDGTEVVYGVRDLASQKVIMRFGNNLMSWITSVLYGTRLHDMETCYKMMSRKAFEPLNLECKRFDVEAEITAKLLKAGHKIVEMPISYEARYENKKLSPLDGIPTLWALLKYRF